jgi:hypothetical protein
MRRHAERFEHIGAECRADGHIINIIGVESAQA